MMVDQSTFMETVKSVAEIIRVAATPMSEQEILSYFADMELDEAKKQIVLEYLLNPPEEAEENAGKEQDTIGDLKKSEKKEDKLEESHAESQEDNAKSAVFQMYLEELEQLQRYSEEEELELYRALLAGDQSAIAKLSDCWLLKVLKSAQGYLTPKLNIEDLVQEGNMALFLALQQLCGAEKCDDAEGVLLAAVEEGIMNYASEISGIKESEEAVIAKVNLVHEARKLLTEEQGSVPSVEELAEYTKMSVEELRDIIDILEEQNKGSRQ
jgi:RNA polymerase primary sigma factor